MVDQQLTKNTDANRPLTITGRFAAWRSRQNNWPFAAIWLVFLGFSFAGVLTQPGPAWQKWVGATLLTSYALWYLRAFAMIDSDTAKGTHHRNRWRYLAVLAGHILLISPLVSPYTELGMLPYLVAYSTFALSWRQSALSSGLAMLVVVGYAVFNAVPQILFFWISIAITATACAASRYHEEHTERTHQRLKAEALAAERERVARDVHDVLGHTLTVLTVKAELAEKMLDRDVNHSRRELVAIQELVRQSLQDIRGTVSGLRAVDFNQEILRAQEALEALGCTVKCTEDPGLLAAPWRTTCAWAVRELTTNVLRHSNATEVALQWGVDWVSVSDDGVGVGTSTHGNGLTGVTERVQAGGGTVTITPTGTGQHRPGTRVHLQFGEPH